jgi:hypothetical protein
VKRLLRPHRKPVDEPHPLDAEHLLEQALLHPHIVGHRELRIAGAIERRRRVARGGRQPVAELVDDDDEIPGRIERLPRRDLPFEIRMLRPVRGRVDDDVCLPGIISRATSGSERMSPRCTFQSRNSVASAFSDGTMPTATFVAWLRFGP